MKRLTPSEVAAYDRDGVVAPIPVLDAEEVRAFREAIEELRGSRKRLDECHLHYRWGRELAAHPRVLEAVHDLIGEDAIVHSTRVFYKPPRDPAYVSWHQDGRYSGLNDQPVTTAWIALSDSNVENGCLRVVPGSHRSGLQPHEEHEDAVDNLVNHGQEIAVEVDERSVRDVILRAGEMSCHHINMVHGSNANGSSNARIGYSVTYVPRAVLRRIAC